MRLRPSGVGRRRRRSYFGRTSWFVLPGHATRLLEFPPLLIVEVASPSTRAEDWGRKRRLYALGGAAWYWIVDPDAGEIAVMANDGDQFSIIDRLGEGSTKRLDEPFPVTVDLAALFT